MQSDTEAENRGVELSLNVKRCAKQERKTIAVSMIVSRGKIGHDDTDDKIPVTLIE